MPTIYNKVVIDGDTLMDISDTTATATDVGLGKEFYTAAGTKAQGTAVIGNAISVVDTVDTNGGTIRTITAVDISDTTAVAADVTQGKYFYTAEGIRTEGTGNGGGSGQGYTVTTIISEQTVTPSAQQDGTIRADLTVTGIIEGNSDYLITYNNDEYLFTSKLLYNYIDVLGGDLNYLWSSSSDGLYPFLIVHDRNDGDTQICVGSATSCTVKVEKIEFFEPGGNVSWNTLFNQTIQVYEDEEPPNYSFISRSDDTISVGDIYRVTFNGATTALTAKAAGNRVVIGNPGLIDSSLDDSSGLTYCIYDESENYKLLLTSESEDQYVLVIQKQVSSDGGGSSGQTATGTVTGSGTTVLQIPCSFEPDLIYLYGDLSGDMSLRGVTTLTIIKDVILYQTQDGSSGSVNQSTVLIRDITGYNESDTENTHASYSNGTLTINTVANTAAYRFAEGITYSYELSTIGTGGGGSSATLITKTIAANGTYSAQDDSADGYSSVTVNVPPSGITPTGSINIGTNGTHDVTNYASAVVSVPTGGGSSATQHVIHLVLEDETTADVNVYYDDAGVSSIITSSKPTTYNTKTIETASLDGVQWYVHETWETIYENVSVQFISDPPGGYFWISSLSDVYPVVDSIWRITLDGTEYRCTAVRGSNGQIYIGNPFVTTGVSEDNVYPDIPFTFSNAGWGAWVGDSRILSAGSYPLKIERLVTT